MLSGIHLDVETYSADVLVTARKIDLNLFRVFDAVMRLRSVTAAGQELGVTASAVSHALSRLRENLHDDLFILGPAGVEATAYIATLPRSFALQVAASGEFVLLEPPYAPLSVDIELIWHQRSDSDSGAQWMIGEWRETFGARDGAT